MIALWPRCWQLAAGRGHRWLKGGGQVCQQQVSLLVRSSSGGRSDPAQPEGSKLKSSRSVKEWSLAVSPFGLLKVQLPCHMTLCPLDPHKYPNADRVFVTARGANNSSSLDRFHVHYDEVLKEVMILSDDVDSATSVDVKIPVKFDLDIKMSRNGCVKVEKIECDRCRIEAEKGASVLQSVKSQKIDIKAKGGKVICLGTLQGNADIHVSQGSHEDETFLVEISCDPDFSSTRSNKYLRRRTVSHIPILSKMCKRRTVSRASLGYYWQEYQFQRLSWE